MSDAACPYTGERCERMCLTMCHIRSERIQILQDQLAAKDLAYRQERDARLVAEKELGTASWRWQADLEAKDRDLARAVELLTDIIEDDKESWLSTEGRYVTAISKIKQFLSSLNPSTVPEVKRT